MSKCLPIVFCLDVSPSMGWKKEGNSSSIELLNSAVANFFEELKADVLIRNSAEVAFVTFSTKIEMDTEFCELGKVKVPYFSAVKGGGTQLGAAVIRSIEKIEKRVEELEDGDFSFYAPFLILVTDGNPDDNDNKQKEERALELVKSHCDLKKDANEVIVPFIIGVGDYIAKDTLNSYAEGFVDKFFHIRGNANEVSAQFGKVFDLISNSSRVSCTAGATALKTIQNDMKALLADLVGI